MEASGEKAALKAWLKELREQAGISQETAADMLGVSRKTIYNLENPAAGFANGLTVLRYLRLLGVVADAPPAGHRDRLQELAEMVAEYGDHMTRGLLAVAEEVRALMPRQDPEGKTAKPGSRRR